MYAFWHSEKCSFRKTEGLSTAAPELTIPCQTMVGCLPAPPRCYQLGLLSFHGIEKREIREGFSSSWSAAWRLNWSNVHTVRQDPFALSSLLSPLSSDLSFEGKTQVSLCWRVKTLLNYTLSFPPSWCMPRDSGKTQWGGGGVGGIYKESKIWKLCFSVGPSWIYFYCLITFCYFSLYYNKILWAHSILTHCNPPFLPA